MNLFPGTSSPIDPKKKAPTTPTSDSKQQPQIKKIKTESNLAAPTANSKKPSSNGSSSASSTPSKTPNGSSKTSSSSKPAVKSESKTPVKQDVKTPTSKKDAAKTPSSSAKTPSSSSKDKKPISSAKSTPSQSSPSKSSSSSSKKRAAEEPQSDSPRKKKKKEEEEEEVWRWWEEKKYADGRKWTTLEHKGPVFDPGYTPLPDNIPFFYNGERVKLSKDAEEVMTFYAKMLDHDYTKKDSFNTNFFNDWRKVRCVWACPLSFLTTHSFVSLSCLVHDR